MFNNYRESTTSHTCPLIADEVVKQIEDKMVNKSHEVALAAKHKQHAEAIDANGYFTALNWVLSLNKKEGK
jgi:phosphoribosyl-ATP pyrophosphohydrolase